MSRFKVGDKVRVRKDLAGNEIYGGIIFSNEMCQFKGEEAKIINIDYYKGYALEEMKSGNHYYVFTDEMLEPVEEIKVEKGDLVEITNGTLKGVKGKIVDIIRGHINIMIDNSTYITIKKDSVKLVEKAKKEGVLSIVSFEEKCKYILQGDKTTVILPSGTKGQVKLYKGDKYNKDLGIKLAYHKAKFNEAIKEIENN